MKRSFATLSIKLAFAVALAAACGQVSRTSGGDDAGIDADGIDAQGSEPRPPGFGPATPDGSVFPHRDASFDGSFDPGGDADLAPVVACDPANAGHVCKGSSVCLDDHWIRSFFGLCGDAGQCEFTATDMQCPMSPVPPACYQGGCRIVAGAR